MTAKENSLRIKAPEGFGAAKLVRVPLDLRLTLEITPEPRTAAFGLLLRGDERCETGCELRFCPDTQRVELGDQSIFCVEGLMRPFGLDIVITADIIDVCVDQRRCLIQRCPQSKGGNILFFCFNGEVAFASLEVRKLL